VHWRGLWLLAVSAVGPVFGQAGSASGDADPPGGAPVLAADPAPVDAIADPSGLPPGSAPATAVVLAQGEAMAGEPGLSPGSPPGPAAPVEPSVGPGLNWRIPPVIWSGAIGYDLRLDRTGSEPHRTQQLLSTTLNALTYIFQPWLATVNGSVSVNQGRDSGGLDQRVDHDQFVSGSLRLDVFPRSRFPLEVRYDVSDSRTDASLGGNVDYRARNLAVTQRYRPADGGFNLSASYERRAQEGQSIGEDSQESLMADFSTRWKRQALTANLTRSINRRQLTDEEIDFRSIVARHTYAEGSELTVETGANWAQSDERLLLGPNSAQVAQWSSVALWRPEGRGLTVSASARGFTFDSEQQGTTETVSASLGASYELTHNLRLNGNVTLTRTNGVTASVWVGALSGSYQGDTLKFGEANYNWFGSASMSQSRTQGLEDNTLSTQLGHALSRTWPLDSQSAWTGNLSQTLSTSYSFGDAQVPGRPENGLSRALTHSAGLTWYANAADRNAYARISASDARQLDGERDRFQLLNLQVSGTYEVDRFRSWSGDLTVQRVLQRSQNLPIAPQDPLGFNRQISQTASGEITWRQQRLFDVPRLRFQSRLRLSQDARSQSNALLSIPDREDASWENRIDYEIGRLQTSGTVRVSRTDGLWRGLVLWRVQRSF
jgi:hypothetical protein